MGLSGICGIGMLLKPIQDKTCRCLTAIIILFLIVGGLVIMFNKDPFSAIIAGLIFGGICFVVLFVLSLIIGRFGKNLQKVGEVASVVPGEGQAIGMVAGAAGNELAPQQAATVATGSTAGVAAMPAMAQQAAQGSQQAQPAAPPEQPPTEDYTGQISGLQSSLESAQTEHDKYDKWYNTNQDMAFKARSEGGDASLYTSKMNKFRPERDKWKGEVDSLSSQLSDLEKKQKESLTAQTEASKGTAEGAKGKTENLLTKLIEKITGKKLKGGFSLRKIICCCLPVILIILLLFMAYFFNCGVPVGGGLGTTMNDWFGTPCMSVRGGFDWVWNSIFEFIYGIINEIVPDSLFGVPLINPLEYRACDPFCITPTGEGAGWAGLEVIKLELYPSTVYDYQQLQVVAEIQNKAAYPAVFEPPIEPKLGCQDVCEFNLDFWLIISGDLIACDELCPLKSDGTAAYATGACAKDITYQSGEDKGKLIPGATCTLEPQDTIRLVWYGIKIKPEKVDLGEVLIPGITLHTDYTFYPQNDLIGNVVVVSPETQVETSEYEGLGRIVNKVSTAYSPTGPLMMAMGTAEEQVVEDMPTLFLIQFANKGSGMLEKVENTDIKLYVPGDFAQMTGGYCDFHKLWKVNEDGEEFSYNPTTNNWTGGATIPDDWKPYASPSPADSWIIYEANDDLTTLRKTLNPADSPIKGCVFFAPADLPTGIDTYTFKARVKKFIYSENRSTTVKIIGTDLGIEGREGEIGETYGSLVYWKLSDSYDFDTRTHCKNGETLNSCYYAGDIFFSGSGNAIWSQNGVGLYDAGTNSSIVCSEVNETEYSTQYQHRMTLSAGKYLCVKTNEGNFAKVHYITAGDTVGTFEWWMEDWELPSLCVKSGSKSGKYDEELTVDFGRNYKVSKLDVKVKAGGETLLGNKHVTMKVKVYDSSDTKVCEIGGWDIEHQKTRLTTIVATDSCNLNNVKKVKIKGSDGGDGGSYVDKLDVSMTYLSEGRC